MTRLFLLLATFALCPAVRAEGDSYRSYLKAIDGYNRLFRIGTYQLKDGNVIRDFDLFYYQSDKRPYGQRPTRIALPLSFDLFCIWKNDSGQWTHKEILGLSIDAFDRVDFVQVSPVVTQAAEASLAIELIRTEGPHKRGKPKKTSPLHFTLKFSDGIPIAAPVQKQGEQVAAPNP